MQRIVYIRFSEGDEIKRSTGGGGKRVIVSPNGLNVASLEAQIFTDGNRDYAFLK